MEGGRERERQTFEVSMDDAVFVKVHNAVYNLPGVVTDDTLCKRPKVMEDLIQTPSSHPLDEDINVTLVLRGSKATDNVGV